MKTVVSRKGRIEGNISNDGEVNECVSAEGGDAGGSSLVAPTTPRMRLAILMRREFKELAQNDGDSSFAGNSDCQYVCTGHFYLRDKPDVWSCVVGNKERGTHCILVGIEV